MFVLLLLILLIVACDQITKWLAVIYLQNGSGVEVIPNILRFTYVENRGAAFGMLDGHRWVFMLLSVLAITGLLIFLWRKPPKSLFCRIAIAFLIGGGIGNMIDRTLLGYVIDFIDFCAFPEIWMWVFNVADAFVTVGTGMLMLYLVCELVRDFRREREEKLMAAGTAAESAAEDSSNEEGKDNDGE